MKTTNMAVWHAGFLMVLAVFVGACANDVKFLALPGEASDGLAAGLLHSSEDATNGSGLAGGDGAARVPVEVSPDLVAATCVNRPPVRKTVAVNFDKPSRTCDFNQNGNLDLRNLHFQARIEQIASFDLPTDSVICALGFRFERQRFRYDDYFAMTFDGVVIAASFEFGRFLEKKNDLQIWDWRKVVGMPWDMSRPTTYCAGNAQNLARCQWPPTETEGDIILEIDQRVFQKVAAMDIKRSVHEFHFITTGDDNPDIDCLHEPLKFEADIGYVQGPSSF